MVSELSQSWIPGLGSIQNSDPIEFWIPRIFHWFHEISVKNSMWITVNTFVLFLHFWITQKFKANFSFKKSKIPLVLSCDSSPFNHFHATLTLPWKWPGIPQDKSQPKLEQKSTCNKWILLLACELKYYLWLPNPVLQCQNIHKIFLGI